MHVNVFQQKDTHRERYINTSDINIQFGYTIEAYAQGLDAPSCIAFSQNGDMLVGESGYISGKPSVLRYRNGIFEKIADGFNVPISGICPHNRKLYVSHLGKVTIIKEDGTRKDIIGGLPSQGDHWNSNVTFGADNKLYFGQGGATNSGVVGNDNLWVNKYPFTCDNPGDYIILNGQNFESQNIFSIKEERILTGGFSPYGIANQPYEVRKEVMKASGSILRANEDGTKLELVAWGFRFPTCVRFDQSNRLFVANQGFDIRGSRPIANAPDEFHVVVPGVWYGWPDYAGGEPVTYSKFKPEEGPQPDFLLANHPNTPPRPFVVFPTNSYIVGFAFNDNPNFGTVGDAYITEFGTGGRIEDGAGTPYGGKGHRISKIDMNLGEVTTFAINKSGFSASLTGEGGLSRPVDIAFGEDGAMYVVDFGLNAVNDFSYYYPNTGVIWRIKKI